MGRKIVLAFGILLALLLSLPAHAQDGQSEGYNACTGTRNQPTAGWKDN